uniref:E3 ubiquitin-protein ligase CSU1 isoform X1 n=1 Tax=Elaeis guineensis var. tenera TaxID=51953 RepID=A0A6J0PKZ8_ELAGV|nr:E3 ubiquitin-protein ligase CSU1 isoform X1 [Elaeis guineensis]
MPQRHSKNNDDLAFFTYDEKRKRGYGTQREHLGKDSIKPFDACCLCLMPFIDPLFGHKGHVFCKECIREFLLAQKKDIKRIVEVLKNQPSPRHLPLHYKLSLRAYQWRFLMDKVEKKFAGWKKGILSRAGCLVLVNSVIQVLRIY